MNKIIKFPSIERFDVIKKRITENSQFIGINENGNAIFNINAELPTITFYGFEKIHGTNCAIQIYKNGEIICQSRNRIITEENDQYDFSKFIKNIKFTQSYDNDVIIYGEYAGQGIQDVVGYSKAERFFYVFNARDIEQKNEIVWKDISTYEFDSCQRIFKQHLVGSVTINFNCEEDVQNKINYINQLTLDVEENSRMGYFLGTPGIGEGIVWKGTGDWSSSGFWFKTTNKKHQKSRRDKLARKKIEIAKNAPEFVKKHADEERFLQSIEYLKEMNLYDGVKSIGIFIKYIIDDIIKEESAEMIELNLCKKDITKLISEKSRYWYFRYIEKLNCST